MEDKITGKIDVGTEFFEKPLQENFTSLLSYRLATEKAAKEDISLVMKNMMVELFYLDSQTSI